MFSDPTSFSGAEPISKQLLACLSLYVKGLEVRDFVTADSVKSPNASNLVCERSFSPENLRQARQVENWAVANDAKIVYPGHFAYPEPFLKLEKPPLFLSFLGTPVWKSCDCLSVVGSREPSSRALQWMQTHVSCFLTKVNGVAVVSGGARGVDQRAHAICIRMGRPTVVFLPSGLANLYPRDLQALSTDVLAAGGAIVSQFSPFQEIRKHHFEGRNRLIAALGKILFVVEAKRRSGSIMTARLARDMGQTTCVLPSFPGETSTAGTLDLLFDGALPLRDFVDLQVLYHATWPLNASSATYFKNDSTPRSSQAPSSGDREQTVC